MIKWKLALILQGSLLLILTSNEVLSYPDISEPETEPISTTESTVSNDIPFYPNLEEKLVLTEKTGYTVEWHVDNTSNTITFEVEIARGNGHLALGLLSKRGQVKGGDVAVFGYRSGDGNSYLLDTHGVDNSTLQLDQEQSWRIVSSTRSRGRMTFKIERKLDTCDSQDLPITTDLLHLIWGYEQNYNSLMSHFVPEGDLRVYLLDVRINQHPSNAPNLRNWRVSRTFHVPPRHTAYWCSIVKGPSLKKKNHIVGFGPYFANELSRRHVHHQLVWRCSAPPGVDPSVLFEPFVNHPGEECYLYDEHVLPTLLCREIVHIWNTGGEPAFMPEDSGFAIGDTENEYFMFEAHYTNTEFRSDLVIENGVDFQFTPQVRENDASIVFFGHGILGLFGVPPQTSGFTVGGHCTSGCTTHMFPPGLEIIGVMPHSHLSANRMRLSHYRDNQELPWLDNDDNYDFNFQKLHFLRQRVRVFPGDQLSQQCGIDNTWRNGSTVAGLATIHEMCVSFVYFNKRIPYYYCTSEYPSQKLMAKFGVRSMTWDMNLYERVVTAADNPNLVGLQFSEVITRHAEWTPQQKRDLEREQLMSEHVGSCVGGNALAARAHANIGNQLATTGTVDPFNMDAHVSLPTNINRTDTLSAGTRTSFPAVPPYQPPTCQRRTSTTLGWGRGGSGNRFSSKNRHGQRNRT